MIQKSSILFLVDKCSVFSGNTFHIYKGFRHKFGYVGNFVKFSARLTSSQATSLKGNKFVGILSRLPSYSARVDGGLFNCKVNGVVSLKKRVTPRGKELVGPCSHLVYRRKFMYSFSGVF